MILKKSTEFVSSELGGQTILLDMQSNQYFSLNQVGKDFLNAIEPAGTSFADIIAKLLNEYQVDEATLRDDLLELVQQLKEQKLIIVE